MKLKKSIPMYLFIISLFTLGLTLTTYYLISYINIKEITKENQLAIQDAIISRYMLILLYIYLIYTYSIKLKVYWIKQQTNQKLEDLIDNTIIALKNKIKGVINDTKVKSNENIINDVTKDTIFPHWDRITVVEDKIHFEYLNKDIILVKSGDLAPMSILAYIVKIMRTVSNTKILSPEWMELPLSIRQAINFININHINNIMQDLPLIKVITTINNGEFINKDGKVDLISNVNSNNVKDNTLKSLFNSKNRKNYYQYLADEFDKDYIQVDQESWKALWLSCKPIEGDKDSAPTYLNRLKLWESSIPDAIKQFVLGTNKELVIVDGDGDND